MEESAVSLMSLMIGRAAFGPWWASWNNTSASALRSGARTESDSSRMTNGMSRASSVTTSVDVA